MVRLNLRSIRERKQLTQKKLSELTGLGVRTIQRYEQRENKSIAFDDLEKLSHALKCHWLDLFIEE